MESNSFVGNQTKSPTLTCPMQRTMLFIIYSDETRAEPLEMVDDKLHYFFYNGDDK